MAKCNKIRIPILERGAPAKSSDCSSHAVNSHKAQLAVLGEKLPAGKKYFITRSGILLMLEGILAGGLVEVPQ